MPLKGKRAGKLAASRQASHPQPQSRSPRPRRCNLPSFPLLPQPLNPGSKGETNMAGFGFASLAHFVASTFHDIHVGLKYIAEKAIPAIEKAEPIVEGITSIIDPPAVVIERA